MITFLQNCWLSMLLSAVIGYLLGSISFAIIVTRRFSGKDIRSFGSGNAGATNVLRSQGKLPALLTFLGDLAKSMASVYVGGVLLRTLQLAPQTDPALLTSNPEHLALIGSYLAGLCCVLGHIYPVFYGFRGGKGVMTVFGMTLILDWRTALVALSVFILVVLFSRMVSLGSIVAGVSLPITTYLMRTFAYHQAWPTVAFCTVAMAIITAIAIIKHRENIKRIIAGTESKIGGKR